MMLFSFKFLNTLVIEMHLGSLSTKISSSKERERERERDLKNPNVVVIQPSRWYGTEWS